MPGALDWLMRQLGGDEQNAATVAPMMGGFTKPVSPDPSRVADAFSGAGDIAANYWRDTISTPLSEWGARQQAQRDRLSGASLEQRALDPEGLEQSQGVAMSVGPGAIRAYHGSPHSFDRFDLSKVGTGEGAQAYGHGLYFAESEPVAAGYKERLSGDITQMAGRDAPNLDQAIADEYRINPRSATAIANWLPSFGWNTQQTRKAIADWAGNPGTEWAPEAIGALDKMIASGVRFGKRPGGQVYEVDLHADPARLLDWDKPLSGQSQQVRDIIEGRTDWSAPDMPGARIYGRMIENVSPTGLARLGAPPTVSAQLRDWGIPGVKYLDQGSRSAGEGTSNYVMYDDKLIEILRKYGLAGLTAGAGGAAALGGGAGEAQAGALDRLQEQLGRNQEWVRPGEHNYNTPLGGQDEASFRDWLAQNKVPFDASAPVTDYDMRGFWKGLQSGDPVAASSVNPNDNRMHYPDRWKTPYHETFSAGSQWATPDAPNWTPDDKLIDKYGRTLFDERASPLERLMWQLRGELSPPT